MKFNKGLCKVLYLVKNNPVHQERLGADCLRAVLQKRPWESWWTKKIEHEAVMHPCGKEACVRKNIASKSREMILALYSFLLRTHLECCVQIWLLQYKRRHGHTKAKITKMIKGVHMGTYRDRLRELGFFSLEEKA